MNLVGKILIVVQVFMSICFMLFAGAVYSTHRNWQTATETAEQKSASLQETLNLQSEANATFRKDKEAEVAALEQRATTAEAAQNNLENRVTTLEGELQDTRTERDRVLAENRVASEESKARQSEAIALRDEIAKQRSKIDELVGSIRGLEDRVLERDRTLAEVSNKYNSLLERSVNMERLLRVEGIDPDTVVLGDVQAPPPDIEARVVEARRNKQRTTEYVQISAGSDDGLEVGHQLVVFRSGRFLGNIKLISVYPDDAVGVVVPGSKNGVIGRGDFVKAKI